MNDRILIKQHHTNPHRGHDPRSPKQRVGRSSHVMPTLACAVAWHLWLRFSGWVAVSYSFLMSQYPGKLASLAFFPNRRSHTSAICEASGDAKLVGTWIVVPLGIPARSCLSLHSNTAAMILSLIRVGRNFYSFIRCLWVLWV